MSYEHQFEYAVPSPPANAIKSLAQSSSSENIRERLNLHVKRRIQVQEKVSPPQQVVGIHSSSSSCSSLSPNDSKTTMKHDQNIIINTTNISHKIVASTPIDSRAILQSQSSNEPSMRKPMKTPKKSPAKMLNADNRGIKYVSQLVRSQNDNISYQMQTNLASLVARKQPTMIVEINPPSDSMESSSSSVAMRANAHQIPTDSKIIAEKSEKNCSNSHDILQMVLNDKKNRLLHDPEVQRFLSAIHKKKIINRNKR